MNDSDIPKPLLRAWAAGVFEAKVKIGPKNELNFDSVQQAFLERFVEVTGCGYVRDMKRTPPLGNPQRRWATKSLDDTRNVCLFVLPLLSDYKAAQVAQLLKRIEGNPTWQKRNGDKKKVTS